eukprot:13555216-Ditylum_brightwellii.AAC.1
MEEYGEGVVKKLQNAGILPHDVGNESRHLGTVGQHRWKTRDGGITKVPYSFSRGFSASERASIEGWLDELATASGVLKFIPRKSENDFVNIVDGSGCSSFVGKNG